MDCLNCEIAIENIYSLNECLNNNQIMNSHFISWLCIYNDTDSRVFQENLVLR